MNASADGDQLFLEVGHLSAAAQIFGDALAARSPAPG